MVPDIVKVFLACIRNEAEPSRQHYGVCFLCSLVDALPPATCLEHVKSVWPQLLRCRGKGGGRGRHAFA